MSLKPKNINFKETWEALQETIKNIITLSNVPRAVWNDRFSDIYSLCVAYPDSFENELYNETEKFLEEHVYQLLSTVSAQNESNLLQAYHRAWCEYSQGTKYLHRLYLHLNEHHIRKQKFSDADIIYGTSSTMSNYQEQLQVGELGLDIWKKRMIMPLKKQLVSQLLDCIHADRVGKAQITNTDVIWGVIHSFVQVEKYKSMMLKLKLYQTIFEQPFLEASGEFYTSQAFTLRQKSDVRHYMVQVSSQLALEELRAHKFLHSSSVPKVKMCCENKMIASCVSWLHTEAESMIENENRKDLSLLYLLLRSLPDGLNPIVEKLTEHIIQQGLKAIENVQGDNIHTQFVESMLDVHKKYSELIKEVFQADLIFVAALDKACSAVVNHKTTPRQPAKAPELLARYCDSLLRKSARAVSEGEVEEKLANCITVFKYVNDKDVFQKFYARMLAKRLIHQLYQSMDAEESMIERLKQACGYEFTNKLHRMFTDISVSADLNAKFTSSLRESDRENQLRIGFSVNVLQAGAWPLAVPPWQGPFHIPQQLEKAIQAFETFYHGQFNGRKVTWLYHLCQGELKFNYLKKSYQVTLHTYQMALLFLFEHCNSIQCREAATSLHLSHDQLMRHAASLVDSRILKKSTEGDLEEDTVLSLNFDYTNKRTKFRITGSSQRDVPQENNDSEATHRSVDEDRKLYLQAAIVRIMKSRKILTHNQLVQEVLSQPKVTFIPSIGMIKKCIEALIDKQYIERTPNKADEYSYVA
ncbi:cullin 2 [Halictus rubicundus]|uniref:cullin 2 n=1 Tax=Halictus rubicundus TaxID=77578 RepID=UPI0040362A92